MTIGDSSKMNGIRVPRDTMDTAVHGSNLDIMGPMLDPKLQNTLRLVVDSDADGHLPEVILEGENLRVTDDNTLVVKSGDGRRVSDGALVVNSDAKVVNNTQVILEGKGNRITDDSLVVNSGAKMTLTKVMLEGAGRRVSDEALVDDSFAEGMMSDTTGNPSNRTGNCPDCVADGKPWSPPPRDCDAVMEMEENNNDIKCLGANNSNFTQSENVLNAQETELSHPSVTNHDVSCLEGSPNISPRQQMPRKVLMDAAGLSLGQTEFVNLHQTKAVLLGEVGAGKTSLLNALRFQESRLSPEGAAGRTVGIEVHSVQLRPNLRLWVYDFGGHDTYHFSQQLFLSPKALYILTVDISDYDSERMGRCLRHWYRILTHRLAGPVICVVATHADQVDDHSKLEHRCEDIRRQLQSIDEEHISTLHAIHRRMKEELKKADEASSDSLLDYQAKSLWKPIKQLGELLANRPKCSYNVCCVSSKTMSGLPQFCDNLVSIIMDNENIFPGVKIPRCWVDLADEIASRKSECPFMPYEDFVELSKQHKVPPEQVPSVLRHLQSSGVVLHYDDFRRNSQLKQHVFSNPNLLLSILGLVFNHNYHQDEIRFVSKNKAILKLPQFDFEMLRRNLRQRAVIGERLLKCFWDALGIKEDIFVAILSLLERFDLCYELPLTNDEKDILPEGRHFMFPYLLKEKIPAEAKLIWPEQIPDGCVEFRLSLDFQQGIIPFGFQEKVSVRINPYLEQRVNWKQGIVAYCSEGQDIIRVQAMDTSSKGNKKCKTCCLLFSVRVQSSRTSMARHILLLLAAVTNRVLTHYYPGVVALWRVHCAHCIALSALYPDIVPDTFPADNVVMATKSSRSVRCCNCIMGEELTLGDIFPPKTSTRNTPKMMSSHNQQALQRTRESLLTYVDNRRLVTKLLRKGLVDVNMAETVMSQPNSVERNQKLLSILPLCGDLAFGLLVDTLKTDTKTEKLAKQLQSLLPGTRKERKASIKRQLVRSSKPKFRAFWVVGTPQFANMCRATVL